MKRTPYQHVDRSSLALFLVFLVLSGTCIVLLANIFATY